MDFGYGAHRLLPPNETHERRLDLRAPPTHRRGQSPPVPSPSPAPTNSNSNPQGYREGEYDSKFIKLGLPELCSTRNGSEADGTQGSKQAHEEATVDGKEGKGKEKEGLGGERVEEEGK